MEYAGNIWHYSKCRWLLLTNHDDTSASLLEVFKNKNFSGLFPEMVEFGMGTWVWTLNKSFINDFDV